MKKILVSFLLVSFLNAFSQEDAWVYFNDKPNAQTFLDNPLSMLSQRALDRRENQGITLTVQDTPIYEPYVDQISNADGLCGCNRCEGSLRSARLLSLSLLV